MTARAQLQQLKRETDPERACELALELLRDHRERQIVDAALAKLKTCTLGEGARAVLRPTALYYLDHPERDSGCNIRDALVRLLVEIANPADLDVYLRGVEVHEQLLGVDVGQTLRASSLVGIAMIDPSLGNAYAVRLLADLVDTSRFSGEPAMTALSLLHEQGDTAPIYLYLRMLTHVPAPEFPQVKITPEVESKALELIAGDFPAALYREVALPYVQADRAIPEVGIVSYIVANGRADLFDLLEMIVSATRHDDLHRYAVIEMAASRHAGLINLLYHLAGTCPAKRIRSYVEAIELTTDSRRDETLAALKKRA
jgi:hypothetical protein